MSKVICEREELVAVADAIREKSGTTNSMTLDGMATLIDEIETGGGTAEEWILTLEDGSTVTKVVYVE